MSLFRKCLIFLLFVLALQLGVFSLLGLSLIDAEKQADRLAYSHRVVSGRDRVSHVFYEAMQTTMLMALTANKALGKRLDEISRDLPVIVREMEDARYATPEDRRDLAKISQITLYLVDELRFLRESIADSGSQDRFRQALSFVHTQVNPHLQDLSEAMTSLEQRHRRIEQTSAATKQLRDLLHTMIAAGFAASITATIAIVIAFALGVSNRIKVIADNMFRYASGKALHPQQGGRDEISMLDGEFHALSKSLSEAREKDEAVFANMPVGLITCLPDGQIEDLNEQARRIFGVSAEEQLKVQQLLLDEKSADKVLSAQPQSQPTEARRIRWKRSDGSQFPAEMSIARFMHNDKSKSLLALLDVSDREHIENLRQEFVAIVSHDIRSPLTSIGACLSLFSDGVFGEVNDKGRHHLQVAMHESERLMRLTKDLLDMARIESGNIRLNKTACTTQELIRQSIAAVELGAARKGVIFVSSGQNLSVKADADRVIQIIVNFLSNAIKYTPSGKEISLSAERVENMVRISVTDEGPGIPPEFLQQIFERFQQVHNEDQKRGTGLGLAVCRMLAEAHDGTVGVTSELGKGSTFWLALPVDQS